MAWRNDQITTEQLPESELAPNKYEFYELVIVLNGAVSVHRFPAQQRVIIGRDADCDVVVDDASVSRRHLSIEGSGTRAELRDLGSSNGTFVDGRRIDTEQRSISPGQSVRAGRATLVWSPAGGAPSSTPLDSTPFVFAGEEMNRLRALCQKVAPTDLSVLLTGETGTGKEVFADVLHTWSGRRGEFVKVNCSAFSSSLLESELFGHVRGAFTGATSEKRGLFQEADGGTLLLDEIGDMPPELQPKLLRTLEQGTARPVGSAQVYEVDVRVVSSTNVDLHRAIELGDFRQDLFYRLNGITLQLPPLREHPESIIPLARHFLRGSGSVDLSKESEAILLAHSWPGNARELRQTVQRAAVLSDGRPILPEHIMLDGHPSSRTTSATDGTTERERIERALSAHAGNQTQAARELGMSRSTLIRRIAQYGLARPKKSPKTD